MKPKNLDSFPSEDGHIESILIGFDQVKVSFQTWDSKKLWKYSKQAQTLK